jgi:phage gp36-like protein
MAAPIYADVVDYGRFGVNTQATEDLPSEENLAPPLSSASRVMDSYLGKQFNLPLTEWADDLRECCVVIASLDDHVHARFKPGENPEDQPIGLRYLWWIDWLKQVAKDEATPVVTETPEPGGGASGMSAGAMVISNESRQYQDDKGAGWAFQGRRR